MAKWIFTWGYGHKHPNRYIKIEAATAGEAREEMFRRHGKAWAFQYDEDMEAELISHNVLPLEQGTT